MALTATIDILQDIAENRGPEKFLLALGYAGWGAGQLDGEIRQNAWLHVPDGPDLTFAADNDAKWEHAIAKIGVDLSIVWRGWTRLAVEISSSLSSHPRMPNVRWSCHRPLIRRYSRASPSSEKPNQKKFAARFIVYQTSRFDAVQTEVLEREFQYQINRFRHMSAPNIG